MRGSLGWSLVQALIGGTIGTALALVVVYASRVIARARRRCEPALVRLHQRRHFVVAHSGKPVALCAFEPGGMIGPRFTAFDDAGRCLSCGLIHAHLRQRGVESGGAWAP